jgi:hypothetical protein
MGGEAGGLHRSLDVEENEVGEGGSEEEAEKIAEAGMHMGSIKGHHELPVQLRAGAPRGHPRAPRSTAMPHNDAYS